MFDRINDAFGGAFRKLSGRGTISEANVREAMEEVREALLEADVHYEVAESFCAKVLEQAAGEESEPARAIVKFVFPGAGNLVSASVAFAGTWAVGSAAIAYFIDGVSIEEARRRWTLSRRADGENAPQLPPGTELEPQVPENEAGQAPQPDAAGKTDDS